MKINEQIGFQVGFPKGFQGGSEKFACIDNLLVSDVFVVQNDFL